MSTHATRSLSANCAHLPTNGGGPVRSEPGSVHDELDPAPTPPDITLGHPNSAHGQPGPLPGQPGFPPERLGSMVGHPGSVRGQHFRSVLGKFATGVVAITAIDPETGEPCGLAANSFTSVSLDPPLVAFCVAHTSTSWPRVKTATTYCVNVLAEHQQPVCAQLAAKGGDKFADLAWSPSPGGNPVIDGALAWIECSLDAEYVAGDHVIVVARVHQLDKHDDHGPLLFFQGGYGGFQG